MRNTQKIYFIEIVQIKSLIPGTARQSTPASSLGRTLKPHVLALRDHAKSSLQYLPAASSVAVRQQQCWLANAGNQRQELCFHATATCHHPV